MKHAPFFSIVVLVGEENASLLPLTMDSIAQQGLEEFETILIDGTKKGGHFKSYPAKVYSSPGGNLSVMANQGTDLAAGKYLHFLQPGEFYISQHSLRFLKEFIDENHSPDLVYTGSIIRHSLAPPQQHFQPLGVGDIRRGRAPQGLSPYWFKKEAVLALGEFDPRYKIQGGFDLLCRFYRSETLRKAFLKRILADYAYRLPKAGWILRQLYETFEIIVRHFGLTRAIFAWAAQNYTRFFRWWSKSVKAAFWKEKPIS